MHQNMTQLAAYWKWFKADRKAWVATVASVVAWVVFATTIANNAWQVDGAAWLAMGAQLACYAYIALRYLASVKEASEQGAQASPVTSPVKRREGGGWWYSPVAVRLTPPVVALGGFITVAGALGEFAPSALAAMGGGFSPEFIRFALIAGPLWTLAGIRLMLAQVMRG